MDKIKGIKKYILKEIDSIDKDIEEKAKAKFYNDAALLQAKREAYIWCWGLVSVYEDKASE